MPSFMVHDDSTVGGPATHALIVGVGHYPHLIGGGGDLYPEHGGMMQLSSPPLSALAFAEWLTSSFSHPDKPLASIHMIAGANGPVEFEHPLNGTKTVLERPTFENLQQAALQWKARGDSHPDNLMLFYFCGHGIANGPDLALILEDFGVNPDTALEYALDFRRFRLGMERCKARHQCFLIDACRAGDSNIIDAAGYAGRPIFTPTTRRDRELPIRQMPAFYSTFAGERAQSRTDKVSLFTDAMLRALKGGGADDTEGDWWIDTNQLQKSVQFMMERAHEQGYPSAQINPVDDMSMFQIHKLASDPTVPVVFGCRPSELNEEATLTWETNGISKHRDPQKGDWITDLSLGDYTFKAQLASGASAPAPISRSVRPPYRTIYLEVS